MSAHGRSKSSIPQRAARKVIPMSGPVPSPCTNVCRMDDASGWCLGCLRTLDEIACWSLLDDAEKAAVWQTLVERRVTWTQRQPAPGVSS